MSRPVAEPLLTVKEVMAYLRCSRAFCYRNAAQLGAVKVGSAMRFTQAGIDDYLKFRAVVAPVKAVEVPPPARERKPALRVVGLGPINPLTKEAWA